MDTNSLYNQIIALLNEAAKLNENAHKVIYTNVYRFTAPVAERYCGWTNRATWALMLHLDNTVAFYDTVMAAARVLKNVENAIIQEDMMRLMIESLVYWDGSIESIATSDVPFEFFNVAETNGDISSDMAEELQSLLEVANCNKEMPEARATIFFEAMSSLLNDVNWGEVTETLMERLSEYE